MYWFKTKGTTCSGRERHHMFCGLQSPNNNGCGSPLIICNRFSHKEQKIHGKKCVPVFTPSPQNSILISHPLLTFLLSTPLHCAYGFNLKLENTEEIIVFLVTFFFFIKNIFNPFLYFVRRKPVPLFPLLMNLSSIKRLGCRHPIFSWPHQQ